MQCVLYLFSVMLGVAGVASALTCGERGVKLIKLHKVGGTTISNILTAYAKDHGLHICPEESKGHHCNVSITHKNSLKLIRERGEHFWFNHFLPDSLSVMVMRDPRERILSRFFYDMAIGRIHHKADWATELDDWLDKRLPEESQHYLSISRKATVEKASDVIDRVDIVGITERMDELVAMIAYSLGCEDLSTWAYTNDKVIVGRPTFANLSDTVQKKINSAIDNENRLYLKAKAKALEFQRVNTDFAAYLDSFRRILAKTDQNCTFTKQHKNKFLFNTPDCIDLQL